MTNTAKKRRRRKASDIQSAIKEKMYAPDHEDSLPRRGAHFLNWAAERYPKEYIPYNFVVRAIMGYGRTPRMDSEEVERYRGKMTRIRQILQNDYGRELTSSPGIGVRATVADDDILRTEMMRKVKRFRSAKAAMEKTASLISVARLPASKEKRWFENDVASILKTLKSPAFEKKLLPPTEKDKGEQ